MNQSKYQLDLGKISKLQSVQSGSLSLQDMKQEEKTGLKVIVVGAGLSGLTAARELLKSVKCQVTVLQANDYVGGRTKTSVINDVNFDLGAQFIGPTQTHAIELALQSKNDLIPVDDSGRKVIHLKEGSYTYTGEIPSIGNIFALIEMQFTLMKLNRMAKKVPQNPGDCLMAAKWDSMTVQSWIEENLTSMKTRVMIEGALRVILGVELSEVSFLYLLYYVRCSRDFQNLITIKNGLQEKKTSKGTQHMSIFLSEEVKSKGGQIKLNFFVKSVEQSQNKVVVTSSNGEVIEGSYLIMAMPPPNVNKVAFSPALSVQRRMICERSFMGSIAKVLVLYPEAYWKKKGFSGEVLSDCFDGPAVNVFDDTRSNSEGKFQPALAVFIGGGVYKFWKGREDFQKALVLKLAEFFKQSKMLHPTDVVWHPWEEKTAMGGPVANFPPGVLSNIDDLRKPDGRIHWAGTEMARESVGFMDGAIESGKRVAKQVVRRHKDGEKLYSQQQQKHFRMPPAYSKANIPPKLSWMTSLFEWW